MATTPRIINETRRFQDLVILFGLHTVYGDTIAFAGTDALLVQNATVTPLDAQPKERAFYKAGMGNRPFILLSQKFHIEFEVEAVGSGTPGVAPAWGKLIKCCGRNEVIRAATPDATIAAAAVAGVGAVGSFTYVRSDAYDGTLARTVTLTCTIGGASGVAEFTVSAPALYYAEAYEALGQVMTDAAEFPLIDGATITPTITGDFTVGDSFTIAVTPAGVEYVKNSDRWGTGAGGMQTFFGPGERHQSLGMRGNFTFTGKVNDYPLIKFALTGFTTVPTDDDPPTPDLSAFKTPEEFGTDNTPGFNLFGWDFVADDWSVDAGVDYDLKERVGQALVQIKDQKPAFTGTVEQVDNLDDINLYELTRSLTTGPVLLQHGTEAGKIVGVSAPALQLEAPKPQDSDGDYMLALSGKFMDSPESADNAFTLFVR